MLRLTRPDARAIAAFLAGQRDAAFTHDAVGATRDGGAPAGYTVDHNRVRLGSGHATFTWISFDGGLVPTTFRARTLK